MRHWTRGRGLAVSACFTLCATVAIGIGWPEAILGTLLLCTVLAVFVVSNCQAEVD